MDISLATTKTPKSTQAAKEKPCVKPYHGTSIAAPRKVNENSRIFVQIRGAPAVAGDAELGAVGRDVMAVGGSTDWPVKLVKHSTVPHRTGNGRGIWEGAHAAPAAAADALRRGDLTWLMDRASRGRPVHGP